MGNGYWTQLDDDLDDKEEFVSVVAATRMPSQHVEGHLCCLWRWVNKRGKPCVDRPGWGEIRPCSIDALVLRCGADESFWRTVAEKAGWLEIHADHIAVPGYDERFGNLQKKRTEDAERKRQQRARDKGADPKPPAPPQEAPRLPVAQVPAEESQPTPVVVAEQHWIPDGTSQFDTLSEEMLGKKFEVLRWAIQVAQRERGKAHPLGEHEEMFYVRVLGAARHATTTKGIRSPLALFKTLIGSRAKDRVPIHPDHIKWATTELRKLREETRTRPEKLKALPREHQLTLQFLTNLPESRK